MSNSKVSEGQTVRKYMNRSDKLYKKTRIVGNAYNEFETYGYNLVTLQSALEAVSKTEAALEMHIMNMDPDGKAHHKAEKNLIKVQKQKTDLEAAYNNSVLKSSK